MEQGVGRDRGKAQWRPVGGPDGSEGQMGAGEFRPDGSRAPDGDGQGNLSGTLSSICHS